MLSNVRQVVRLRDGRLLLFFAATIVLPGILRAVFSFRAWQQERRLAEQQVRERLERAAELAARDFEEESRRWEQALAAGTAAGRDAPDWLRGALRESGAAILLSPDGVHYRASPPAQLLYELDADASDRLDPAGAASPALAAAEALELQQKNSPAAVRAYEALLRADPASAGRAHLLLRLARTYRKAGRAKDAQRAYAELAAFSEARVGGLPVTLVAAHELCRLAEEGSAAPSPPACALDFYRDLVTGRWLLPKASYLFYAGKTREWLGAQLQGSAAAWQDLEHRKRALTEAVEAWLLSRDTGRPARLPARRAVAMESGTHLVLTGSHPEAPSQTTLLLQASYLATNVWPHVFRRSGGEDLNVSLVAIGGERLFGADSIATAPSVTRSLEESGLPWRVHVQPREPGVLYAGVQRRQNVYLTLLVFVVALLLFGAYLTARTMRHELAVARLQADFVSIVSHEFRSPLTSIRQLGEMLMRGRVPSEQRRQQYYELITRESERLTHLMERVLDFSRMEEGRKRYALEPLDPKPWLCSLASDFQEAVARDGVTISAAVPESLPTVLADRDALASAVQNLLDNAVKYTPGCRTVWIEAAASDGRLVIQVRDEGIGIVEGERRQIFKKFYRSEEEAARRVKGVGLGLSLVKQIVTAHGGTVDVQSRIGEGSTFTISLPVAAPPPAHAAAI